MLTTRGTGVKVVRRRVIITVLIGVVAMVPVRWRAGAQRAWSYAVYYVGYRLLSVHLSCHSLAVSGVPFVLKYA
jgi:hypothetical protein